NLDELPEEASFDKNNYIKAGAKSTIVIPLLVSGKVLGGITFDTVRHEVSWPDEIIQRCRLLGAIFSNALMRKKSELQLHNALREIKQLKKQAEADYNYLKEEIEIEHNFHEIIGQSKPIKNILSKINQVAATDATVLILGETGTGKELVARAIHNNSRRKNRPLVKVNCATLSPNLIESELFGHEKGAFTGAHMRKLGRFEAANGTTLFLDEIGELPIELQAKLLRVVQDGEFERIGSVKTIKVDVRIITATNRDLEEEVRNGRFRQDLLYRLNVYPITIPPLRKREPDIPLLVNWFVMGHSKKLEKKIKAIPQEVMERLTRYHWPGNVRELENLIERAVINTNGPTLRLMDRLDHIPNRDLDKNANRNLNEMERHHILKVLKETNWRISGKKGAALILGLHPNTLRGRMEKLNIRRE
ncbi:MAG: sigma 54-interacting transcriptional regulator, partial [Deltaproteobacteria bacterium]|nr:sigma 54-interacting transcriptional regulator [Deltaproteobacteria bacterium]